MQGSRMSPNKEASPGGSILRMCSLLFSVLMIENRESLQLTQQWHSGLEVSTAPVVCGLLKFQ